MKEIEVEKGEETKIHYLLYELAYLLVYFYRVAFLGPHASALTMYKTSAGYHTASLQFRWLAQPLPHGLFVEKFWYFYCLGEG